MHYQRFMATGDVGDATPIVRPAEWVDGEKRCSSCGHLEPPGEFYRRPNGIISHQCKLCTGRGAAQGSVWT